MLNTIELALGEGLKPPASHGKHERSFSELPEHNREPVGSVRRWIFVLKRLSLLLERMYIGACTGD